MKQPFAVVPVWQTGWLWNFVDIDLIEVFVTAWTAPSHFGGGVAAVKMSALEFSRNQLIEHRQTPVQFLLERVIKVNHDVSSRRRYD